MTKLVTVFFFLWTLVDLCNSEKGLPEPPTTLLKSSSLSRNTNATASSKELEENPSKEGEDNSAESDSSSQEKSDESDGTCSLTFRVPAESFAGCSGDGNAMKGLEKLKQHFGARIRALEDRVQNVLSDESNRESMRHLEDKLYQIQMELETALDLDRHGTNSPVLNKIILRLQKEKTDRKLLESRLKELERRNQDTDCRLMSRPGVYTIRPLKGKEQMDVFCNDTWLVIQKRIDGTVNFYRDWASYKRGFGNLATEFWLGNDNIHFLTTQSRYRLRIDMADWYGRSYYAEYDHFWIENEDEKYRLHVEGFTGNIEDSLSRKGSSFNHNGMSFSTYNSDNDQDSLVNCAVKFKGAWWYNDCYASNLNGRFCDPNQGDILSCIVWYGMMEKYLFEKVTMRIKERI